MGSCDHFEHTKSYWTICSNRYEPSSYSPGGNCRASGSEGVVCITAGAIVRTRNRTHYPSLPGDRIMALQNYLFSLNQSQAFQYIIYFLGLKIYR
jgi:hypothetical protein